MAQNSSSLNQIAYNLLNIMRGGRSSQSEHLSLEQLKYAINYYRAMFIRRDAFRNNNRLRHFEQDLGHVALTNVDTADTSSFDSGRIVKRTVELPTPIRLKDSEGFTFIGSDDKFGEPIPVLDSVRAGYQKYSKYTSSRPYAVYKDGRIWLFNDITMDNLNIRGVFEDPEEVFEFTADNNIDTYDADQPYPISTDMLEGITKGLINGELKVIVSTPNDEELDHLQDSNPQQ